MLSLEKSCSVMKPIYTLWFRIAILFIDNRSVKTSCRRLQFFLDLSIDVIMGGGIVLRQWLAPRETTTTTTTTTTFPANLPNILGKHIFDVTAKTFFSRAVWIHGIIPATIMGLSALQSVH